MAANRSANRNQDTPLPGQERCPCGRLVHSEWAYCPGCGRKRSTSPENESDGGGSP